MNFFSKQLLYAPASTPTEPPTTPPAQEYEAYRITIDPSSDGTTYSAVVDNLGTITDLSKTFSSADESTPTPAYVFEGDLYLGDTKITTSGKVTAYSGCFNSSYYGFYIEDGKLMRLKFDTKETLQMGEDTTWSKVSGYTSTSTLSFGTRYRAFGVNSSGLYSIEPTTTTQVSTITSWDKIVGYGATSSSYYGYGISNGTLYSLYASGSGATQVGSDTDWVDIVGSSSTGYGLRSNKKAYVISSMNAEHSTVAKISGQWGNVGTGASLTLYTNNNLYLAGSMGTAFNVVDCCGMCTTNYNNATVADKQGAVIKADGLRIFPANWGSSTPLISGEFVYVGGTATKTGCYIIAIKKK